MSPRVARRLLVALLLWSFALRLIYAWPDAVVGRFYDERFAIENIRHVLATGRIEPVNGFHPMLSWLPTAAVLAAVRGAHDLVGARDPFAPDGGRPTAAFYRWGRAFHAGLGVLAIFLAWRLGRRLGGRTTGLLAAVWLAALPLQVRFSALINEEMPYLVGCELALLASLAALRSGSVRRFAAAGAAIGVALATKFSAAPVSLPLVVGASRLRAPWSRRIGLVALAAAIAALTLVAVSPSLVTRPELHARDFTTTVHLYEREGREASRAGGTVAGAAAFELAGPLYFGAAGAILAVGGALAAAFQARRRPRSWRRSALAVASFPPLFLLVYSLATRGAPAHAWLPVSPLLAVAAGFGGRELIRLGGRRGRAGAVVALAVAVAAPAAAAWRSHRFVYEELVPTCADRAALAASTRLGGEEPRTILVERGLAVDLSRSWRGRHDRLAYLSVDAAAIPALLAGVDGALVSGPASPGLLPEGTEVVAFEPGGLRLRGRPARLLLRPWRPAGEPVPVELAAEARGLERGWVLPDAGEGPATVSVSLELPRRAGRRLLAEASPPRLRLASGRSLRLVRRRLPGGRLLLVGERFELERVGGRAVLETAAPVAELESCRFLLWRWRPPADALPGDQSPASSSPSSASASSAAS